MHTGQAGRSKSSVEVSFQVTLTCVKLTTDQQIPVAPGHRMVRVCACMCTQEQVVALVLVPTGTVTPSCNPSTRESTAGGSLPTWAVHRVLGQSSLQLPCLKQSKSQPLNSKMKNYIALPSVSEHLLPCM